MKYFNVDIFNFYYSALKVLIFFCIFKFQLLYFKLNKSYDVIFNIQI